MTRRLLTAAAAACVAVGLIAGATPAAHALPARAQQATAFVPAEPAPIPAAEQDPVRAAEYWLTDYGVAQAWATTRGAGVTIAVIDTGVANGPVEFQGAVVGGTDVSGAGADDGRTPVGNVDSDHGSWVASLAAGRGTGPDTGMIGVAPEAEVLSVSVAFGESAPRPFADQIADAIRWSVDHGADVINMSLTTNVPDWPESWDDAFLYAFEHDVVIVVAAGNRGSGTTRVGAPATIPGVLTVGGVDRSGKASVEASTQGITIGVSAPSEELVGVSADSTLVSWDGTSGAAPIVAGIAALVRAAHPELDANNVINRIVKTARPPAGVTDLPDVLYGYGLVDATAAVTTDVPAVTANPMGSLEDWVRLYRRAPVAPVPEESVPAPDVPALPEAEPLTRDTTPLLPDRDTVLYGTLPLSLVTVAAILVALGVTAAVRRIRLASRAPSR